MVRCLLIALAMLVAGCASSGSDPLPLPPLTPQATRPTLSLPTRPASGTDLPRIYSSFDFPPPSRTPFAFPVTQGDLTPAVGGAIGTPTPVAAAGPASTPGSGANLTTPTLAVPTATRMPSPTPTASVVHRFVVSTRARSYYYCDTDTAWKGLSPANLRWFDSEKALKAAYPRLTLHAPCG